MQDDIFRTGSGTTNHLSISGGNESTSYYVAGSWTREDGIIRATDHDKKSGRINLSQRLTDELRVDANANFVQSHTGFMTEGE